MEKEKGFNSNQLKFIAILTMTLDHLVIIGLLRLYFQGNVGVMIGG